MVINHDMIFGSDSEEENERLIEKATVVETDFGQVDKTTVLAAIEFYARERIRKTKYRRSGKGRTAKRRELDSRKLARTFVNLIKRDFCICSLKQSDCEDIQHKNIVEQYKQIISKYGM